MIEYKHEKSIPWENNKEEWEASFRNKWEGANADKRNWAISTEAMNDMTRDIRTLLTSQKQSIMKEIAFETALNNAILNHPEVHHIDKYKAEGANQALSDLKERINKEI